MPKPPKAFLLDSNIFDKIADDEETLVIAERLVESGRVVFLSTHVQTDEIARTPDEERIRRLLGVPVAEVPTYGFVVGYSRVGMARLSNPEPFETLRGGNLDHTEDALIAATAEFEGATLVTEDRQLRGRAIKLGIDVIGWAELRAHLHEPRSDDTLCYSSPSGSSRAGRWSDGSAGRTTGLSARTTRCSLRPRAGRSF